MTNHSEWPMVRGSYDGSDRMDLWGWPESRDQRSV